MLCEVIEITDGNTGWVVPAQYSGSIHASGHIVPAIFNTPVKTGAVYSMTPINKDVRGTLFRFQTDPKNKAPVFDPQGKQC